MSFEKITIHKDEIFHSNDMKAIWNRFCGFLDLSLPEFMEIQRHLLQEEIGMISGTPIGKAIMKGARPNTIEDFRKVTPLTTYDDYRPFIGMKQEDTLADKPYYWAHTSGSGGIPKWVPFFERTDEVTCRNGIAALILAAANKKGEINIRPSLRYFVNFPPRPYAMGWGLRGVAGRVSARVSPTLDQTDALSFQDKTLAGMKAGMAHGIDFACCMSSILVKVGDTMADQSQKLKLSSYMLQPQVLLRLIRAKIRAQREGRPVLPRDLWNLIGIMGWGVDSSIYRERIEHYWGKTPLDFYVATESAGFIALQSWTKKAMTLLPDQVFYEFIPELESRRSQDDPTYVPSTILADELQPGQKYEIIITGFYGSPFVRYRLGDLIKVVALEDPETGIKLPQILFDARTDGYIGLAGFAWLNERVIYQALASTGLRLNDWIACKEYEGGKSYLRIYAELHDDTVSQEDAANLMHEQLKLADPNYKDLETMLEIKPLRVTLFSKGTFSQYLATKEKEGRSLAQLKPRRVNASNATVAELMRYSAERSKST